MSHLYTMFAKQVNTYCKSNTADHSMKPQCKRDLLLHGLGNLNKMDEPHLDSMDPYQRGATDIGELRFSIWSIRFSYITSDSHQIRFIEEYISEIYSDSTDRETMWSI